jgi:hypothetical protein
MYQQRSMREKMLTRRDKGRRTYLVLMVRKSFESFFDMTNFLSQSYSLRILWLIKSAVNLEKSRENISIDKFLLELNLSLIFCGMTEKCYAPSVHVFGDRASGKRLFVGMRACSLSVSGEGAIKLFDFGVSGLEKQVLFFKLLDFLLLILEPCFELPEILAIYHVLFLQLFVLLSQIFAFVLQCFHSYDLFQAVIA